MLSNVSGDDWGLEALPSSLPDRWAANIDGISIEEFPVYAYENWKEIKKSLLEGNYKPLPVKRVRIPKDSGGIHNLEILIVMDRVIQQAITQVLNPTYGLTRGNWR